MADADWYAFLTEAQVYWYAQFATFVPHVLMGAPTLMTSADSGVTYTFSSSVTPLAVEVYDKLNGFPLRPGAYWDAAADYVWESSKIRMTRSRARTFSSGPYARYITPPTVIDGSTAPTLLPDYTRILLVYRALIDWAERGGMRPSEYWRAKEQDAWSGNPQLGTLGFLGTLKYQNYLAGAASVAASNVGDLSTIDTGEGYTPL